MFLALGLGAAVGCAGAGARDGEPEAGHPHSTGLWVARPVSVRIYPSTRFVLERDRPILEARIEVFDQMGDPMKLSGRVRCELYAVSGAATDRGETLVHRWDIALRTIGDQRLYYDPITRGYVFRLVIDDVGIARRPTELRVVFETPDGRRLSARAMIRTGG